METIKQQDIAIRLLAGDYDGVDAILMWSEGDDVYAVCRLEMRKPNGAEASDEDKLRYVIQRLQGTSERLEGGSEKNKGE